MYEMEAGLILIMYDIMTGIHQKYLLNKYKNMVYSLWEQRCIGMCILKVNSTVKLDNIKAKPWIKSSAMHHA